MTAQVTRQSKDSITIEVTLPLTGSMLQAEEAIQDALNEVGLLATEEKLKRFDTDGSPIQVGSVRMTSKGQFTQDYETPYGSVAVPRHVYQTSEGGKTFCPLEENARMVLNATPRFAKMVSYKYAEAGADAVVDDLLECQHRKISNRYVKSLGDTVGTYAVAKEETWNYALPEFERPCARLRSASMEHACFCRRTGGGWRWPEPSRFTMPKGNVCIRFIRGATPEYGKEKFHTKFRREVERVKEAYPNVPYIGLGDGAADNWSYLKPMTDQQTLDFYHASEYVGKAAVVMFKGKGAKKKAEREAWLGDQLHQLKHKRGAAGRLLSLLDEFVSTTLLKNAEDAKTIMSTITYLQNQKGRMNYSYSVERNWPIGSGVTEAACKTLIKHRLCKSGSRWKDDGALAVLSIRALRLTPGRWQEFWRNIDQYGCPALPGAQGDFTYYGPGQRHRLDHRADELRSHARRPAVRRRFRRRARTVNSNHPSLRRPRPVGPGTAPPPPNLNRTRRVRECSF